MPEIEGIPMSDFVARERISMVATRTHRNPCMDDRERPMDHWRCVLMISEPDGSNSRSLSVVYSQGSGFKGADPKLPRVLDCLAMDAASVQNADGFEDWASDLGFDPDSRKAERVYLTACFQTQRLLSFLGPDAFNDLLWNVGRE